MKENKAPITYEEYVRQLNNYIELQEAKDKLQKDYQEAIDKINELRTQLSATEEVASVYIKRNLKAIELLKKYGNGTFDEKLMSILTQGSDKE